MFSLPSVKSTIKYSLNNQKQSKKMLTHSLQYGKKISKCVQMQPPFLFNIISPYSTNFDYKNSCSFSPIAYDFGYVDDEYIGNVSIPIFQKENINPHYEKAKQWADKWSYKFNLFFNDDKKKNKFIAYNYPLLMAYCYPDMSEKSLEIVSCLAPFLFSHDDFRDSIKVDQSYVKDMSYLLIDTVNTGVVQTNDPTIEIFSSAIYDLIQQLERLGDTKYFRKEMVSYFKHNIWEAENRSIVIEDFILWFEKKTVQLLKKDLRFCEFYIEDFDCHLKPLYIKDHGQTVTIECNNDGLILFQKDTNQLTFNKEIVKKIKVKYFKNRVNMSSYLKHRPYTSAVFAAFEIGFLGYGITIDEATRDSIDFFTCTKEGCDAICFINDFFSLNKEREEGINENLPILLKENGLADSWRKVILYTIDEYEKSYFNMARSKIKDDKKKVIEDWVNQSVYWSIRGTNRYVEWSNKEYN